MFQQATTQEESSTQSRGETLVQRLRDQSRLDDDDRVDSRMLDLASQKQCYRAVVVLIISIMMNEFMQVWTDDQDHSPLEHHSQKQRDNLDGAGPK